LAVPASITVAYRQDVGGQSRAAHIARTAAQFGVLIDSPIRVDMALVKARKDRIVEKSDAGVHGWLDRAPNVSVLVGHAKFVEPHRIRVGQREFDAPRIFINVGGRALVVPARWAKRPAS